MHYNRTVNLINLVFCTELWLSHEILRYHMLNISCISYTLWDVKRYETLHVVMFSQPKRPFSSEYFFYLFCSSLKSCNLVCKKIISVKIKKKKKLIFFKKYHILNLIFSNGVVIFFKHITFWIQNDKHQCNFLIINFSINICVCIWMWTPLYLIVNIF